MRLKKLSAVVVATMAATSFLVATPDAGATAADPTGKYHVVTPSRIADSRIGKALPIGGLKADTTVSMPVLGRGGVPSSGVQAVVVNITAINPTATGWIAAYAGGTAQPKTSTVNYPKGWTGATTATVPVGADGKIQLTTGGASVQVAIDVTGWYANSSSTQAPGSLYRVNRPERWYDSRTDGDFTRLGPGDSVGIPIWFDEVDGQQLTAMQFNVTATGGYGNGWFTAWNGLGDAPATSVLNFAKGETSPNLITVPVQRLGEDPENPGNGVYVAVFENTSGSSAHLIVDAVGSYATDPDNIGSVHVPVAPTRIADSRIGRAMPMGKVGTQQTVDIAVPAAVDSYRTQSFEGSLTIASPTRATYLTLFPAGVAKPATSTVNTTAWRNRSNGFVSAVTCLPPIVDKQCNPGMSVYNSGGATDVVMDVTGRFEVTDELIAANQAQRSPSRDAQSVRPAPQVGTPYRR